MTASSAGINNVERFICGAAGCVLVVNGLRERSLRGFFCTALGAGFLRHAFSKPANLPANRLDQRSRADAKIDAMSEQSFPASDSPAY